MFHIECVDAALPPVAHMLGWDVLSEYHRRRAMEEWERASARRGGAAEERAPKRPRDAPVTRSVQQTLPWGPAAPVSTRSPPAPVPRSGAGVGSGSSGSDRPSRPPGGGRPQLPVAEALADEKSCGKSNS